MSTVEIVIIVLWVALMVTVIGGAVACVREWHPESAAHRAPSPWPARVWACVDVLLTGWRELAKAAMYRGAAL